MTIRRQTGDWWAPQRWLPNPTVNLHYWGGDENLQNPRLCSQGFSIRICRGQVKNQILFFKALQAILTFIHI